jgi:hypothetical protein
VLCDLVLGLQVLVEEIFWEHIIKTILSKRDMRSSKSLEARFKRLLNLDPVFPHVFGTSVGERGTASIYAAQFIVRPG